MAFSSDGDVVEPRPEWDYESDVKSGIVIRDEYNVALPNFLMHADRWFPEGGGRPPSVIVMLVYMWMLDKTTKCEEVGDGTSFGFVLGGRPIEFDIIAENIGVSWRTIQSAVKYLVGMRLIERERVSKMRQYRYYVPNCRKFATNGKPKPDLSKFKRREQPKLDDVPTLDDDDELS